MGDYLFIDMEQEIATRDGLNVAVFCNFGVMPDMEQEIDFETMNHTSNESGTLILVIRCHKWL